VSPVEVRKQARLAGILYVLMGIPGAFFLQYVPRQLIVRGDPAATAEQLLTQEPLFRLGLAAELFSTIIFIFTVLALFRLFRAVDEDRARLMVIFVLLSVPMSLLNVLTEVAAFSLARGPEYLSSFGKGQLDALALLFLGLHGQGNGVAEIFWGLWLLPLGALVYASAFAPRAIGVLLVAAGIGYVAAASASFVTPQIAAVVNNLALVPEGLGELSFVVWLFATRSRATLPSRDGSLAAALAPDATRHAHQR